MECLKIQWKAAEEGSDCHLFGWRSLGKTISGTPYLIPWIVFVSLFSTMAKLACRVWNTPYRIFVHTLTKYRKLHRVLLTVPMTSTSPREMKRRSAAPLSTIIAVCRWPRPLRPIGGTSPLTDLSKWRHKATVNKPVSVFTVRDMSGHAVNCSHCK